MGGLVSSLLSNASISKDINSLVGETVIALEVKNKLTFTLTTQTGDLYMGQWTDTTQVKKYCSNGQVKILKKTKVEPFVVKNIYQDRYGFEKCFAHRCWVLVDANRNSYELYVDDLSSFSEVDRLLK